MFYIPQQEPNYSQTFINLIHSIKHENQHHLKENTSKIYYLKHSTKSNRQQQKCSQLMKIKLKKLQQKVYDSTLPIIENRCVRLGVRGGRYNTNTSLCQLETPYRKRYTPGLSQKRSNRLKSEDYSSGDRFNTRQALSSANKEMQKSIKSEAHQSIQTQKRVNKAQSNKNINKFHIRVKNTDSKNDTQKISPWVLSHTKIDYYAI